MAMVFSEILAGLSILDWLKKAWMWVHRKWVPPPETLEGRFVRLFESHGVHRNQIPGFMGHGLTVMDVQDDAALLAKLDEPLLDEACKRFAVRREWLDGVEKQVHYDHDFYKRPEMFAEFLDGLVRENPEGEIIGVLLVPEEQESEVHSLLIIQETVGLIGEKPIYRYHLCNNWPFSYWKARAYLTACVAIAWKRSRYIHGARMPAKELATLGTGNELIGSRGEDLWSIAPKSWDPEYMALDPKLFLKGVDPEIDGFGIRSALELWLKLDREGWMAIDRGPSYGKQFQAELDKRFPTLGEVGGGVA